MDFEAERKRNVSYCASYCHTCEWFTGKIRSVFTGALGMLDEYGFPKLPEHKVGVDNLRKWLEILPNSSIRCGCQAEVGKDAAGDRCAIRLSMISAVQSSSIRV